MSFVWVGLGGFLGAVARFGVGALVAERWPTAFPLGVFLINVSGSCLLGLLIGLDGRRGGLPPQVHLALGTGFLGAYTTFSTWSVDTLRLWQSGSPVLALANVVGSVAAGLLAAWLGMTIARLV